MYRLKPISAGRKSRAGFAKNPPIITIGRAVVRVALQLYTSKNMLIDSGVFLADFIKR